MNELIKVLARIKLFSGENMRQTAFTNKYRPAFDFLETKTKISGRIDLIGIDSFKPGTENNVYVTFIKGMINDDNFRKGKIFKISEGGKYILGEGEIIEVLTDKILHR
jgi:translation elongation factor EF-Tu-like GTPase